MAHTVLAETIEEFVGHRAEERTHVVCNTVFTGSERNGGLVNIEGVTMNVSKSGACVYTRRKLERGMQFMVYGKSFGNLPRSASIVWCKRVSNKVFISGIVLL